MNSSQPSTAPGMLSAARTSGMALVITLALLVLVTIAVMAFFSRATANRSVEASRANQVVARQVAATASDYVLGELLSDIPENASASGLPGREWYQVTDAAGVRPERAVSSAATGANFANLLRQSVPSADPNASTHNTATPSQNGRLIPAARWNEPQLNFGGGFTGADQLPHWIYLNRDGSTTGTPSANSVGRFAFNVYDASGLLDANIAGHPGLSGADLFTLKSTQAGADLTAIAGVEQSTIDALVEFRSPGATNASAFRDAMLTWQEASFLPPSVEVNGSTVRTKGFVSRSDLIRYATTQNPGLLPALPYLTHFSLSGSAPGVAVDGNDDNSPDAAPLRRAAGATLTRYRDDGTPYAKEVRTGDILLDRRFSLAKLAWLTHAGPAPGISSEAIQACFGLRWNPTERRWDYVGATGTSVRDEIATLADVAGENRDPNFLELLYAGIGRDSMDLALGSIRTYDTVVDGSKSYSGVGGFLLDEAAQQQVIQIAANIIDQADRDNFPSHLRFNDLDFFGIEDLPYLSALFPKVYFQGTASSLTFGSPPVSIYLIPQLWNPHRATEISVESPSEIIVEFLGGDIEWSINTPRFNPATGQQNNSFPDPPRIGPVLTSVSNEDVRISYDPNSFRTTPDIVRPGPGVSGSLAGGVQPFASSADYFPAIGVSLGRYEGPNWPAGFTVTAETGPEFTAPWRIVNGNRRAYGPRLGITSMSLFTVQLSYKKPGSDVVYPYATFMGQPGMGLTALNAAPPIPNIGPSINVDLYTGSRKDVGPTALRKLDPRTSRFGAVLTNRNEPPGIGQQGYFPGDTDGTFSVSNYVISRLISLAGPEGYSQEAPNMFTLQSTGKYPLFRIWQNGGAGTGYADRDGIRRPADGYLAGSALNPLNPMFRPDTMNVADQAANSRTRPVILQRPFRSVAELGYVFRDQPWKTLDFFSAESADAALLDLFCVSEQENDLRAGKLNPRAASSPVLEALLRQTPYDEIMARNPSVAGASISNPEAQTLATSFSSNSSNLLNETDLPRMVAENHLALPGTLAKPSREAALRALAGVSDFKTWRIFADIIVQAGRFAPGSSTAERFIVESEERVWLSTAIDRNTGDLLFRQTEFPVP